MSRYVRGKEPSCPGASANPRCLKIIANRGAKTCSECYQFGRLVPVAPVVAPTLVGDRQRTIERADVLSLRTRYKESLAVISQLEAELEMAQSVYAGDIEPIVISPSVGGNGTNEATISFAIGDWHSEEIVNPNTINNKNTHNVEIHKERQERFWQSALKLYRLVRAGVKVPTVVLALLGDFITNELHDADSAENNGLLPIDAMMLVEREIAGGINFLLNHTDSHLVIDCHSGNHARTTKKVRIASERGHSLEYYAYAHLADKFKGEPRVTFRVNEGYHSFIDIYSVKTRFHHGHAVKYGGGVGGLTIPANKAIAQWNIETRADLDVFGHFHTSFDGGNFIANGSLIGYNAFAKFIKAAYEVPKQTMFVIDKKHGRTFTCPVYVQGAK